MKKTIISISTLFIAGSMIFSACKKDTVDPTPAATTTNASVDSQQAQSANATDVNNTDSQINSALDDVNAMAAGSSSARLDGSNLFCGVSKIDSSEVTISGVGTKIITYTYDGTSNCGKRTWTRSGKVIVTLIGGKHFRDQGAMWTVSFAGYRTNTKDSNTIQLDGLHTVTNVSGGLPKLVYKSDAINPVIHKVRSENMTITYSDNSTRTWSVARQLSYGYSAGNGASLTISGDTTVNGTSGIVMWGTNRFGHTFTTQIKTPIVTSSDCFWFPSQGERLHIVTDPATSKFVSTDETFINGGKCATGYTITFTKLNGTTKTLTVNW
jgi:hypothetical protein